LALALPSLSQRDARRDNRTEQQPKQGQTLPFTLQFEKAGKIDLQVPIAKVGAMGDHDVGGM
jgi:hypothetical protein